MKDSIIQKLISLKFKKSFLRIKFLLRILKENIHFLLDPNIKLTKVQANQAKNLETYGKTNIAAEHIRQNYWKLNDSKYNKNISIFLSGYRNYGTLTY
ncbi:putative DNA polymerase (T4 gp43-like) [Campylobacter phage CP21]|uniref:DNA polymerase (T4 gp43-like) n=1 Tax=Campylobacter phage CP21 TaxID=2881391 RepID=I7IIA5_9CAUD|nr:putative DNA polymerase (T4 gp43-like) [Campylobacter phage CP21]CCH63712.1 putative DNA polymerase (T4 gp43-like) [Campylobacter phage CP21]